MSVSKLRECRMPSTAINSITLARKACEYWCEHLTTAVYEDHGERIGEHSEAISVDHAVYFAEAILEHRLPKDLYGSPPAADEWVAGQVRLLIDAHGFDYERAMVARQDLAHREGQHA